MHALWFLIHGWKVRDGGAGTVDRHAPGLVARGQRVDKDEMDYGFIFWRMFSWFGRKYKNRSIIKRLVLAMEKALETNTFIILETHSNGDNFAMQALDKLRLTRCVIVFSFSPALNRRRSVPKAIKHLYVYHTRTDRAVRAASYVLFSPWGRRGAFGYDGPDERVTNIDCTGLVDDHSDWFKDQHLDHFTEDMYVRARSHFEPTRKDQ